MKVIVKVIVAVVICEIIPLNACCEKKLKKISRQIGRGRCGDVPKTQARALNLLSQCEDPDIATIENALAIASAKDTYPELALYKGEISSAFDMFDGLPGYRQKFVAFLCTLNQKKLTNNFLRELALALSIEQKDDGERVIDFDQDCETGGTFSLRTNRRWFYWQHDKMRLNAARDGSCTVTQLKKLFIAQSIIVDLYNRLHRTEITYYLQSAHPIHKSWQRWFLERGICARYINS